MRLVRYQDSEGVAHNGWVFGDKVGPLSGSIFQDFRRMDAKLSLDGVRLLPPVIPGKILCVGRNYAAHAQEHDAEVPDVPLIFMKPSNSLIGHNDSILLPPQSSQVEHEAELVVVIGKGGRWISPNEAHGHILGYTLGNDVTARDLQRKDDQWTRAKGFDTFCPLGPWIETEFDPTDAIITCHVNGQMRQMASTRDMVFQIPQLIAFISSFTTLNPGDIIMTGTPAGVGLIIPGDFVEVKIDSLGALGNFVDKAESIA